MHKEVGSPGFYDRRLLEEVFELQHHVEMDTCAIPI